MNIPIIFPVYNQLSYLKNAINWWRWYYPENDIIIVDNGSTYGSLLKYYQEVKKEYSGVTVLLFSENTFIPNLSTVIKDVENKYQYYCISDVDIFPHPSTPSNFLNIWKEYIDNKNYHHVGFNLIVDNLPSWLNEREMIIGNEKELLNNPTEKYNNFVGYKAPIDTTFALYTANNSGWHSPMNGQDWGNSLRIFEAFHLGWYIDGEALNPEMENYFKTSKYRIPGQPSAGMNNNRPKQFQ